MNVEVRPATLRDISYCGAIATDIDKREVLASGPRSMTEASYIAFHHTEIVGGAKWCVWLDGNPEWAFGFTRQSDLTPWLYSAWAWGSDKLPLVMPGLFRWGWEDGHIYRVLDDLGADRIEARSIHDHEVAHRWLLWCGFRRETDLVDWGRDRERFVQFAWLRSDRARGRKNVLRRLSATDATAAAVAIDGRSGEP